eukprot:411459-Pelagomonas_calceolata.AAC.1
MAERGGEVCGRVMTPVDQRVQAAVSGRRRAHVKKTHPAYQMHRDVNAAWNLWEVCFAENCRHPS